MSKIVIDLEPPSQNIHNHPKNAQTNSVCHPSSKERNKPVVNKLREKSVFSHSQARNHKKITNYPPTSSAPPEVHQPLHHPFFPLEPSLPPGAGPRQKPKKPPRQAPPNKV